MTTSRDHAHQEASLASHAALHHRLRCNSACTRVKLAQISVLDNCDCSSCGATEVIEHLPLLCQDYTADRDILLEPFHKAERPAPHSTRPCVSS